MVISPTIEVWNFCLSIEVSIFWISIDVVLPLLPRWWFLVKFQNVWARHQACQRDARVTRLMLPRTVPASNGSLTSTSR